jgi:hypothetical protein
MVRNDTSLTYAFHAIFRIVNSALQYSGDGFSHHAVEKKKRSGERLKCSGKAGKRPSELKKRSS